MNLLNLAIHMLSKNSTKALLTPISMVFKKHRLFPLIVFFIGFSAWGSISPRAEASGNVPGAILPSAILVDKKKNLLHVCDYRDGEYRVLKTYHATLGQVQGDKEDEDDLKTPEGIYTFNGMRTRPPSLKPKFGVLGLDMNFPNAFDQIAGHRGSGIMLHATNEPERLKKNYDSQGCIVVKNEEIQEIKPHIRLGLTPILVFSELTDEYMKPGLDATLKSFFESWVKAWETKNLDTYISHYHTDFSANGKDKTGWKNYKGNLNKAYATIEVKPENVLFYRHPKYSMVTFTQDYRSKLKSGAWGHRSRGTKILYVAAESGTPKIIAETFTQHMW
jgi:murein L,D-transpeptidase YafK